MALQSHLLREAVLFKEAELEEEEGGVKEMMDTCQLPKQGLQELQTMVLRLATHIFTGAYEVR